jgi:membrane protease YdiL (CAAX protease family)
LVVTDIIVQSALSLAGAAMLVIAWRRDWIRPGSLERMRGGRKVEGMARVGAPAFLLGAAALLMAQALLAVASAGVVGAGGASSAPTVGAGGLSLERLGRATGLVYAGGALSAVMIVWGLRRVLVLREPKHHDASGEYARAGLSVAGDGWSKTLRQAGVALLVVLPVCLLVNTLSALAFSAINGHRPETLAHDTLRVLTDAWRTHGLLGPGSRWAWVIAAGAVFGAPIVEEVLHRVCVQSGLVLITRSRWIGIVLSSGLFVLMHVGLGGGSSESGAGGEAGGAGGVPWYALPSLLALSIGLGVAYERTGKVAVPILVHAGFNAANLAAAVALAGDGA